MGSGVPREPFRLSRVVDKLVNVRIFFVHLDELRTLFKRFFERHFRGVGDEFGDVADERERNTERASAVANREFRRHRAENAQLRDFFRAVMFLHVVDDLAATALLEVDIDIGRLKTVFVEETFEKEVEF